MLKINWPKKSIKPSKIVNFGKLRKVGKMRIGRFSVTTLAVAGLVVMGASYIVAINVVSTKGAQVHTLETKQQNVKAEIERLQLEAARLQSLAVIDGSASSQIEIGEDGKPTGRIINPYEEAQKQAVEDKAAQQNANQANSAVNKVTYYVPKMVPLAGMTYVKDVTSVVAQR